MSKYKPLDEPITRREACMILDRKRFDGAVRSGEISPFAKAGTEGEPVPIEEGARTAPLLFNQQVVRNLAKQVSLDLLVEARFYRSEAKAIAKMRPPLTRRQIANRIGKKQTGILIRGGVLQPDGVLTDTQTAAHTYDPHRVAWVIDSLADIRYAESKLLAQASKARIAA